MNEPVQNEFSSKINIYAIDEDCSQGMSHLFFDLLLLSLSLILFFLYLFLVSISLEAFVFLLLHFDMTL